MLKFKGSARAFSLLELIITVTVLSAGITVILQAFSFSGRVTGLSNDLVRAVFLAEDKLQELEFKEKQGLINQEPAGKSGAYNKFQWKDTVVFDNDITLYRINFTVNWQRANSVEEINLKSFLR